jgi:hypothetical protein
LLIEPVALARYLADPELGVEQLSAGEFTTPEILRLGAFARQDTGLEECTRNRLAAHCGQFGFVKEDALAAQATVQGVLGKGLPAADL